MLGDDNFLGNLRRQLQYAIQWLPKGAIKPIQVQPSASVGKVMTTTANGSEWVSPTSGVTDHGLLTGLGDDDHTQYHNDARGDARYWQLSTDLATQAELDAHVNDTTDAHDASAISIADAGGDFTATTVEGALDELQADHETDAAALAAHIADTTDAHDASAISYAGGTGLAATDVEAAIDEVNGDVIADVAALAAHLADSSAAHAAGAVSVNPSGLIVVSGTDVQAAIGQLDAAVAAGGIPGTIGDDKGDLIGFSAADTPVKIAKAAGSGYTLASDTSQTGGVAWKKAPARAKCIVATQQTVTATSFTTLSTPDRATVTLETDGLLVISYHALIKLTNNLTSAIFIGSNQLKIGQNGGAPAVQENLNNTSTHFTNLFTTAIGLASGTSGVDSSVVTTGQIVGALSNNGGDVRVFAAAGTYDVEVRFKVGSGTGTIKDRKLWVEAIPFA